MKGGSPAAALVGTLAFASACGFSAQGNGQGDPSTDDGSGATSSDGGDDTTTTSTPLDESADGEGSQDGIDDDGTTGDVDSTSVGEDDGTEETTGPVICDPPPEDWWDAAWSNRREIHIDNEGISESLTDFPVLLRLNSNRVDYTLTRDDGADVRVVDPANGQLLAHEIEGWNESGDSFVWVRIPTIPAASGTPGPIFHLYYGNPDAPDTSDAAAVWTAGFTSVHHMSTLQDATGSGHNAASSSPPGPAAGSIAGAHQFDGVNDFLALPNEQDYDYDDDLTIEVLLRVDSFTVDWQAIVTKGDSAWRLQRYDDNGAPGFGSNENILQGADNLDGQQNISDGAWHSVAITFGGDTKRIYVDGVQTDSRIYPYSITQTSHPVFIGENAEATGRFFHGRIDEVRASPTARSAVWLSVSHRVMFDQGVVLYGETATCQ